MDSDGDGASRFQNSVSTLLLNHRRCTCLLVLKKALPKIKNCFFLENQQFGYIHGPDTLETLARYIKKNVM